MVKRILITAAKEYGRKFGQSQVIVFSWEKETGIYHRVTWGETKEDCTQASNGANKIAKALGWSDEASNIQPSHVKKKLRKK